MLKESFTTFLDVLELGDNMKALEICYKYLEDMFKSNGVELKREDIQIIYSERHTNCFSVMFWVCLPEFKDNLYDISWYLDFDFVMCDVYERVASY